MAKKKQMKRGSEKVSKKAKSGTLKSDKALRSIVEDKTVKIPKETEVFITLEERMRAEEKSWVSGTPRPVAQAVFKLWLTIPSTYLGMPESLTEKMGIRDSEVLEVMRFKTRDALAKWMHVNPNQLAIWGDKFMKQKGAFKETKMFFHRLTQNMLAALYRRGLVEGDAPRVALYLKVIEDWKEQFGVEHSGGVEYSLEQEEREALDRLLALNSK